jgi:hypothetical protein
MLTSPFWALPPPGKRSHLFSLVYRWQSTVLFGEPDGIRWSVHFQSEQFPQYFPQADVSAESPLPGFFLSLFVHIQVFFLNYSEVT